MEPREGELERVEWVEGGWGVEDLDLELEKSSSGEGGGEGCKTPTKDAAEGGGGGGFDGLPGSGSGSGMGGLGLMDGGEVGKREEEAGDEAGKKAKGGGRGKVLFGLERLDREFFFFFCCLFSARFLMIVFLGSSSIHRPKRVLLGRRNSRRPWKSRRVDVGFVGEGVEDWSEFDFPFIIRTG